MESFQDVLMSVIAVRITQSLSQTGGDGSVAYNIKLTEDDQELHEDQADEQPVDNDVPLPTSALNSTDVDVEQLILWCDRAEVRVSDKLGEHKKDDTHCRRKTWPRRPRSQRQ